MVKPVRCTQCGKHNIPKADNKCTKCGAVLPQQPKVTIVNCSYSGLKCANPCGRSQTKAADGNFKTCLRNTPPPDMTGDHLKSKEKIIQDENFH